PKKTSRTPTTTPPATRRDPAWSNYRRSSPLWAIELLTSTCAMAWPGLSRPFFLNRQRENQISAASAVPCRQGIWQAIFRNRQCDHVIRMRLYATAAMDWVRSLYGRTGKRRGPRREIILRWQGCFEARPGFALHDCSAAAPLHVDELHELF